MASPRASPKTAKPSKKAKTEEGTKSPKVVAESPGVKKTIKKAKVSSGEKSPKPQAAKGGKETTTKKTTKKVHKLLSFVRNQVQDLESSQKRFR